MKAIKERCFVMLLFAALLLTADICRATSPPYLVIQPKRPAGETIAMPKQRYSYGWFGVPSRKHAVRHFGYHRNYTQWSFR